MLGLTTAGLLVAPSIKLINIDVYEREGGTSFSAKVAVIQADNCDRSLIK
jgi:hypothetical protein